MKNSPLSTKSMVQTYRSALMQPFFDAGKLVATAYNKTIWGVEKVSADKVDENVRWVFFVSIKGDIMPAFKGDRARIGTTRACSSKKARR